MTQRPVQPEPFLRGAPYPSFGDVPYPWANPSDTARLPADIWHAATVPAGVRLEVVGDAEAIDIAYRTTTGNLGYRGDGAGISFSVWRGGRKVGEEECVLGDSLIRLPLGSTPPDQAATIYLPEGMQPLIRSLTAVKGEIAPAPERPRWIAYGDSATQGWVASGPAQGWTAIAARKAGLDLVNLGYAAAGRGELVSAEHIAGLDTDVITVAYGASCWSRIPHSTGMVAEGFHGFLDVVRQSHPTVPIVVISPIVRPDAETAPNRLGATLSDIRHTIESVARDRIVAGDGALSLVTGGDVLNADHLADGIHPGDEGHKRLAAAAAKALHAAMAPAVAGDLRPSDLEGLGTPIRIPGKMIRPGGSAPAPGISEPVTAGGFGEPVTAGGFGEPVTAGGFGEPVTAGGFGEPAGGFGEPVAGITEPSAGMDEPADGMDEPADGMDEPADGIAETSPVG